MYSNIVRFDFDEAVSLSEAEMSLQLAMYAVEGLFGAVRVRLETNYRVDEASRGIEVDATSEVGAAVVKVYTGLLIRELGEDAFETSHSRRESHASERACA